MTAKKRFFDWTVKIVYSGISIPNSYDIKRVLCTINKIFKTRKLFQFAFIHNIFDNLLKQIMP